MSYPQVTHSNPEVTPQKKGGDTFQTKVTLGDTSKTRSVTPPFPMAPTCSLLGVTLMTLYLGGNQNLKKHIKRHLKAENADKRKKVSPLSSQPHLSTACG